MKFNVTVKNSESQEVVFSIDNLEHAFELFKALSACGKNAVLNALQEEEAEKFYRTYDTYGHRHITSKKRCTCLDYRYGLNAPCKHMSALSGPYSHAYISDATLSDYEYVLATKRSREQS